MRGDSFVNADWLSADNNARTLAEPDLFHPCMAYRSDAELASILNSILR
jgi:hypothetical protein